MERSGGFPISPVGTQKMLPLWSFFYLLNVEYNISYIIVISCCSTCYLTGYYF